MSYAGFDVDTEYPPLQGGQRIPLLEPKDDGSFEWSHTHTPAFNPTKIDPVVFTDHEMLEGLKNLPHKGVYQAKIVHMPTPVGNSRHHYFPVALLLAALPNGFLIPVLSKSESKDPYGSIVSELVAMFAKHSVVPSLFQIDDERTELVLKRLCKQLGIKLEVEPFLEFVEEGWDFIYNLNAH